MVDYTTIDDLDRFKKALDDLCREHNVVLDVDDKGDNAVIRRPRVYETGPGLELYITLAT